MIYFPKCSFIVDPKEMLEIIERLELSKDDE